LWRVTARVSIFHDRPYRELFAEIDRKSSAILAAASANSSDAPAEPSGGVRLAITGITPLAQQIQRELMKDLIVSFLCALILITAVMMAAQRSIVLGLAAMIPNVFPIVILFGTLGWLQIPVDIASVMTASLALGMAIDGTQHFVTFFREGLRQGQSVERSVTAAYRHCAKAILISALICGLGLLVFAASSCAAVSRCAVIICAALVLMTIGDLVLLPAILMLTGRQFLPHRRFVPGRREEKETEAPALPAARQTRAASERNCIS
jgi:predicted RND superfamily exporter protein